MIKTKKLSHEFKRGKITTKALDDVSIELMEKGFVAIIGATGSGKSTFIQHINALLKPTSGQITTLDTLITSERKQQKKIKFQDLRKRVGIVFQFPEQQLFATTVIEDVMFAPLNFGFTKVEAKLMAETTLNDLGLDSSLWNRAPFQLSGGQKRKVALAGVFVSKPEIVILDEPFAGLDPKSREELLQTLISYQNVNNSLIMIVSHDMDLVWELASKTIVFQDGKIAYFGSTHDLFQGSADRLNEFQIGLPVEVAFAEYVRTLEKDTTNG